MGPYVSPVLKKIKRSTLVEILIAVLLPVFYFFLIGGFNPKVIPVESNNVPYEPLSVIKTDFVKLIKDGNDEAVKKLAEKETEENNVYFCGRLAEYKYFNTDEVIENALRTFDVLKSRYGH